MPLASKDGWEWMPEAPYRWWLSVEKVWCDGEVVAPESVRVPAGRVTTSRCLRGSQLVAQVTLLPLALLLVADTWELVVEAELSPAVMGAAQTVERGAVGASLRGVASGMTTGSPKPLEGLLARLMHGQMAYQGVCSAHDTGNVLQLDLKEGVVYDPV